MSRSGKTAKPAKRVTKLIRLTGEEAAALAQLVEGTAYAEAALLRQWVVAGMQQFRVAEAMRAYPDGQINEGAQKFLDLILSPFCAALCGQSIPFLLPCQRQPKIAIQWSG
jgi:hypothetical protein